MTPVVLPCSMFSSHSMNAQKLMVPLLSVLVADASVRPREADGQLGRPEVPRKEGPVVAVP